MSGLPPGTEVGAERWPWSSAHPDCWWRPWKGVVLSLTDPRVWRGTLAFPRGEPDPAAIREHVARYPSLGASRVPVLWEFGQVEWERVEAVRRYADDHAAWDVARQMARTARAA